MINNTVHPPIRVLIVDDSALMRQQLSALLSSMSEIEVVGVARDGEDAVEKTASLRPEVVILDINMPKMDGITALQYIMAQYPCAVLIFSSISTKGAIVTFEALHLGAFDYVPKPDGTISAHLHHLKLELLAKIKAGAASYRGQKSVARMAGRINSRPTITFQEPEQKNVVTFAPTYKKVVVIGVSTGGPGTLSEILPHFPANFPAPILLVQHMPARFTASFAERLNRTLPMRVVEATHRMVFESGTIYIAPGGKHMHVEKQLGTGYLRASISEKPHGMMFKPSVNVTMNSLVEYFPAHNVVGVLLTGLGDDGAKGMLAIKEGGGVTIAESEESAIVYGMPKAAVELGAARYVLPASMVAAKVKEEIG